MSGSSRLRTQGGGGEVAHCGQILQKKISPHEFKNPHGKPPDLSMLATYSK